MDEREMQETMVGRKIVDVKHDERYTGSIYLTLQEDDGGTTQIHIGTNCGDPYITKAKTKPPLGQMKEI